MKIIFLARGSDQIALIEELKNRGHETILVDYLNNPPARQYADKHYVESTLDVMAVKQISLRECADMVCTACTDQALLTAAKISEELNLPFYIGYETALIVTNKLHMKAVMVENGIPTARHAIISTLGELHKADGFAYPLVVKPVDCNSSKGVTRVETANELENAVINALHYSRTKNVVIEEFKQGRELSADYYIADGQAHLLCATESRKIRNRKSFTIVQSCYSPLPSQKIEELTVIGQKIASLLGITDAPLLVQMIDGADGLSVIEFSARMGGGSKYNLIEILSGVNIMKTYVDLLLGEKPHVDVHLFHGEARMNYVYCSPGVLGHVDGLDILERTGKVQKWFMYKTPGAEITKSDTSGDRVAGYLVCAHTRQEVESLQMEIDASIKVIDQHTGEDIMLHGLI